MNRRSFFRNLVLGLAALPVAVKALGKPVLIGMDVAKKPDTQKIWMCSNPVQKYSVNPAWESVPYESDFWEIDEKGYWRHEKRRGFKYKLDSNPIRFTPKQLGDAVAERLVLL